MESNGIAQGEYYPFESDTVAAFQNGLTFTTLITLPLASKWKRYRCAKVMWRTAFKSATVGVLILIFAVADAQEQEACSVLEPSVCAVTCVPHETGAASEDFSCGDWWTRSQCCNGTEKVPFTTTSVYYRCRCNNTGMTNQGLAVIISAVIVAGLAVLVAVLYVLYRKRIKLDAEIDERDRAVEEAQVYLPR